MKLKRLFLTAISTILVEGMLGGTLYALQQRQQISDQRLFETAHATEIVEVPSPKAQSIPMVQALWDYKLYYENLALNMEIPSEYSMGEMDILSAYTILYEKGILPKVNYENTYADDKSMRITPLGFTEYSFGKLYGNKFTNYYIWFTQAEEIDFDWENGVKKYIAYLGLDVLDDWQAVESKRYKTEKVFSCYSPSAGLTVQITYAKYSEFDGALTCEVFAVENVL